MKHLGGHPQPETVEELEQVIAELDFCCQGAEVRLFRHGLRRGSPRQFATATATDQFGTVIRTGEWDTIEEIEEAFSELGVADFVRAGDGR